MSIGVETGCWPDCTEDGVAAVRLRGRVPAAGGRRDEAELSSAQVRKRSTIRAFP